MPTRTFALILITVLLAAGVTIATGAWFAGQISPGPMAGAALLPGLLLFLLWRWWSLRRAPGKDTD